MGTARIKVKAGNEFEAKAQCVEGAKILSNASLKPSKLKRHLNTHHAKSAMNSKEYFERKKHDLQAQQEEIKLKQHHYFTSLLLSHSQH